MVVLCVIEDPEGSYDERTAAFCAQMLERGDRRSWFVLTCNACDCGCRTYLPRP